MAIFFKRKYVDFKSKSILRKDSLDVFYKAENKHRNDKKRQSLLILSLYSDVNKSYYFLKAISHCGDEAATTTTTVFCCPITTIDIDSAVCVC